MNPITVPGSVAYLCWFPSLFNTPSLSNDHARSIIYWSLLYRVLRFGNQTTGLTLIFNTFFCTHSGISLIAALVLLPVSFGSDFMEQFCGEGASIYYRGQCSIDWSLFVAMVVTACSLYLPSLAIFSMNVSDGLQAHVCC